MIKGLDSESIGVIHGEQVIKSVVSAVKELMENSIDAGASKVAITVYNLGLDEIQVLDNGLGMDEEQLAKLGSRGATSKNSSGDINLGGIKDLGFRGEALYGISSITKQISVVSKTREGVPHKFDLKTKQVCDGVFGGDSGTLVSLKGLFYLNKIRQSEIKDNQRIYAAKILSMVKEYSLVYSDLELKLMCYDQEGMLKLSFVKKATDSVEENLRAIFGPKFFEGLSSFRAEVVEGSLRFRGFVSDPAASLDSVQKTEIYSYFNRRPIKLPKPLLTAIEKTLLERAPRKAYFLLLMLEGDYSNVDVNLNKAKTDILFSQEKELKLALTKTIAECLADKTGVAAIPASQLTPSIPRTNNRSSLGSKAMFTKPSQSDIFDPERGEGDFFGGYLSVPTEQPVLDGLGSDGRAKRDSFSKEGEFSTPRFQNDGIGKVERNEYGEEGSRRGISSSPGPMSFWGNLTPRTSGGPMTPKPFQVNSSQTFGRSPEASQGQTFEKADFANLKILGQFNRGFILTLLGERQLFVVDQHAADEKANFERLRDQAKMTKQMLAQPLRLELGVFEHLFIQRNIKVFADHQYDIEMRGEDAYILSFPSFKSKILDMSDFKEILSFLMQQETDSSPPSSFLHSKVLSTIASNACRSSVMVGENLSQKNMEKIVSKLASLKQPFNCPHGRPTLLALQSVVSNTNEQELDKYLFEFS